MPRYRLIFDGHYQPGLSPEDVQQRLAALFKVEPHEISALFSTPPVILKENLSYEEALRNKVDFEATGALCRLEPLSSFSTSAKKFFGRRRSERPRAADRTSDDGERRYGLLHPYAMAFFSRAFYADVAAHWRGRAFVHLLVVLLLAAAAYTRHFQSLIDAFVTQEAPAIIAQVPRITITDGTVHVSVAEPYTIREPDRDRVFAVIDTTGQITSFKQTNALLLLTASRLAVRLGPDDIRIIDLSPIDALQIDRAAVSQWLADIQAWLPFIVFPLALGFSFIFRSLQALLYGGLGVALAGLLKTPIAYGAAVSVAIMAMTPVLLLDAVLMLTHIYLPLWGVLGFLLAVGYLVFGIRSALRPV
jgi:hypothetical protein